jgi:hypothetical protein
MTTTRHSQAVDLGAAVEPVGLCPDRRCDFLIEMYRQTSMHLGRHVTGVWQSVGVVGSATALFAISKDRDLNDYACALVVVLCGWLVSTALDASNWFNRNITIITNIERLFLQTSDAALVHPFFLQHRSTGNIAGHFQIQLWLAIVVAILVLAFHLHERVLPGLGEPLSHFDWPRALPWLTAAAATTIGQLHRRRLHSKDAKLQNKSPGRRL